MSLWIKLLNQECEIVDHFGNNILGLDNIFFARRYHSWPTSCFAAPSCAMAAKDFLLGVIVQVLGQAVAFLEDRQIHDLIEQFVIFDRKRCPLYQGGKYPLAVIVEFAGPGRTDVENSQNRVL